MKLSHHNHLMYCLNIHPGDLWEDNLAAISHYALQVKSLISPHDSFALGLRLSAQAAHELLPQVDYFADFLRNHNLYVVTINGISYGLFQGRLIKENIFLPDWSSYERVQFTINLAKILVRLLPDGESGTICTVPCHYGKKEKYGVISNLQAFALFLEDIKKKTGKHISLALEPEPDCYLDTLDSTLNFFDKLYHMSDESVRQHIGICLDTCHATVEFGSPLSWLRELNRFGIQVPKIQISAALCARSKSPEESRHYFIPFNEIRYLHQTRVHENGGVLRYRDLIDAILDAPFGEWRVHYHVPLTWLGNDMFSSAMTIENEFFTEALNQGGKQFEVETYKYNVIPGPKRPIINSIVSELEWVIKKFGYPFQPILSPEAAR